MIRILAIGNSFSQDATHYLHQIAEADGVELLVANLYIGGCNLERHWHNMESKEQEYLLEINGESTNQYVSVQEALAMEEWDFVVTQQASHDSGIPGTYQPYLSNMISTIKEILPKTEILLQETWAYEMDSQHPAFPLYHQNQQDMYQHLSKAYKEVAADLGLRLIPCGDVIQGLRGVEPFLYGHGGMSLCRDGFHMNLIYGRYLLSAVWYQTIVGNSILHNTYLPKTKLAPNAICDEKVLQVIKGFVAKEI